MRPRPGGQGAAAGCGRDRCGRIRTRTKTAPRPHLVSEGAAGPRWNRGTRPGRAQKPYALSQQWL